MSNDDDAIDPEAITDPDNSELTEADFARARPFKEVLPEIYAKWKNKGGRPKSDNRKVHIGLRLSADVVNAVKATGKGYNARVDAVLKAAIADGSL